MQPLFYVGPLSVIMMVLVGFVALVVSLFSKRYLAGNRDKKGFYCNLVILIALVFVLVCADNVVLFLIAWGGANYCLVRLMGHKRYWPAAKQSSLLALRNFATGFLFLLIALVLLSKSTHSLSIQTIIHAHIPARFFYPAIVSLIIGVMTQSALWPFHRWLTSSLNSPTPVSAIMHAGLVNGGGFLLTRFAPLLIAHPIVLMILFIIGIWSAFLGTFWKLLQHDVKRMLACSTVGQMGFMVAQCGLGLFPAAVAHLCWHGLYKANLFLGSGSAVYERKGLPPRLRALPVFLSLICGVVGALIFLWISQDHLVWSTTPLILTALAFLTAAQFSLPVLSKLSVTNTVVAFGLVAVTSSVYGLSVRVIEQHFLEAGLWAPQPLNWVYLLGLALLIFSWFAMLLRQIELRGRGMRFAVRMYVWGLNTSQPHPKTVTTHHNDYQS